MCVVVSRSLSTSRFALVDCFLLKILYYVSQMRCNCRSYQHIYRMLAQRPITNGTVVTIIASTTKSGVIFLLPLQIT